MRLSPFVAAALLSASLAAHADTVFNASGIFNDGSILRGMLTINTTTGSITGSNLIVSGASNFTFVNIVNQSYTQVPMDYNVGDRNAASTEDFNFDLPDPTQTPLIGYAGSRICSASAPCVNGRGSGLYNLTTSTSGIGLISGALTLPTPEPSSFLLLGTGILGVAGALKRRFA